MLPAFSIPIAFLLIPYGIFILVYALYSFFTVYHLLRFGVYGFHLYIVVTGFVFGAVLMLAASAIAIAGYDWSTPFSLTDLFNSSRENIFDL